jgi:hypothetical protein
MAIYDQKCKLSKRTNRQISLALLAIFQISYWNNDIDYRTELHSIFSSSLTLPVPVLILPFQAWAQPKEAWEGKINKTIRQTRAYFTNS